MNGISPAVRAGTFDAAFARHGGLPHAPRMVGEVAAVVEARWVATERSAVPAPRLSEMSPEALVAAGNRRLAQQTTRLEFIVRRDPAGVIVRLVDAESGDVIRQYSTAKLLDYAVSGSLKAGGLIHTAA